MLLHNVCTTIYSLPTSTSTAEPSHHPCSHDIHLHQLFCHCTQDHSLSSPRQKTQGRAEQGRTGQNRKIEFLGDSLWRFWSWDFWVGGIFRSGNILQARWIAAAFAEVLLQISELSTRGQCSIVPGKNLLQCQNRQKVQPRLGQKMRTMISKLSALCAQLIRTVWGMLADRTLSILSI